MDKWTGEDDEMGLDAKSSGPIGVAPCGSDFTDTPSIVWLCVEEEGDENRNNKTPKTHLPFNES